MGGGCAEADACCSCCPLSIAALRITLKILGGVFTTASALEEPSNDRPDVVVEWMRAAEASSAASRAATSAARRRADTLASTSFIPYKVW